MFTQELDKVLNLEGKYSNHKSDSGGATMYGITERVALEHGYTGAMIKLPIEKAKEIYYKAYWKPLELDAIYAISPPIAEELFDTGVNQGVGRAAEYFQRSLNALNRKARDFADVRVDRDIGPSTLRAFNRYLTKRGGKGEIVILRCLNSLQGAFYVNLVEARPKDEDFLFGWFLNRVVI